VDCVREIVYQNIADPLAAHTLTTATDLIVLMVKFLVVVQSHNKHGSMPS